MGRSALADYAALEALRPSDMTKREWAQRHHVHPDSYRRATGVKGKVSAARRNTDEHTIPLPDDKPHKATFSEDDYGAFASSVTSDIRTLNELVAACKVDLTTWRVDKHKEKTWQGYRAAKSKHIVYTEGKADGFTRDDGGLARITLYGVEAWFVRREEKPIEDAIDILADKLKGMRAIPAIRPTRPTGDYLLVPAFFDVHTGRRAHSTDYSPERTSDELIRACEALIARVAGSGERIAEVLFIIGQDGLDTDNGTQTTTRGTFQVMSADQRDAIDAYAFSAIAMIERLLALAPVKCVAIPGNHDRYTTYAIAKIVAAWFRGETRFCMDNGRDPRRYHLFGVNLIGMDHGDTVKASELAMKMAVECPKMWAVAKYRTWFRGHFHKKSDLYQAMTEQEGVSVVTFPAFCPPNEWEKFMGYVGRNRAAEARLYHREHGPAAIFPIFVDELPGAAKNGNGHKKKKAA